MNRRKMINMIHALKNKAQVCNFCGEVCFDKPCQCGHGTSRKLMEEQDYRNLLHRITGHYTCSECSDIELSEVLRHFQEHGGINYWQKEKLDHENRIKKLRAMIAKEARSQFGEDAYKARVDGFVRDVVKAKNLWVCDDRQLRQVIGWLRRNRKYGQKA